MCQIQKMTHLILTNFCCFSVHARDAAVVIANNICSNEKEFVKLMNKKALEIGMTGTTYMNSHGLDEETKNYSTAHDMALLSSYIYRTSKEYRKITKTYKYEVQSNNKSYL